MPYTYEQLDQRNPDYARESKHWPALDALHEGGFAIQEQAESFLPQLVGENKLRYQERVRCASYINYLGAICDQYIGQLFEQELVVAPAADKKDPSTPGVAPAPDGFWQEFAADADLKGNDFVSVVKEAFSTALLKRRGLIGCDFPATSSDEPTPATRAEEDELGKARGYAFAIPVEELLDWEYSSVVTRVVQLGPGAKVGFQVGRLKLAILKREIETRAKVEDSRGTIIEEFKVWTIEDDGRVAWRVYRTPPHPRDQQVRKTDEVPLFAEGVTTFTEIPIVEICMPKPLWLGNKLGTMAIEHFQDRTALRSAINRSLIAIPYIKLGPEIGGVGEAQPSDIQQNPARGDTVAQQYVAAGMNVIGADDEIGYAEPEGKAYDLRAKLLNELVDEFYRVTHQMASSISSSSKALGRSGQSKQADYQATATVLSAFGAIVRDVAKRVYDVISTARKEAVIWVVHGLDKFQHEERETLLKEAGQAKLVSIPSKTFRSEYSFRLAMALLGNIPPETQEAIKDEILEGVEAEDEMRDVMLESLNTNGDEDEPKPGAPPRGDGGGGARQAGASNGEGAPPRGGRGARPVPPSDQAR